ncbi:MAG TPA: Flp pilus assembly protein CpaB [Candidatus Binataceae bacterium]|nr:Flp pilus assembly protein CpaB [Candidatus Binataceae bacterium]
MRRSLLFMMLAGVAALVAALVVYSALKRREREVQEAMAQSVNVVVAAHDLHIGTKLDPAAVKLTRWSRDSVPPGAFTDVSAVIGKFTKTPFVENEPIVGNRLFTGVKTAGVMPLLIPPGMRAMSVPVDEVSDIAGFVLPGAHVDVLVALQDPATNNQPFSKIVLQNVETLAVAQEIEQGKDEPKVVKVVTLLVTPEEAERLALASREGNLRLALRNYEDTKVVMTNGANVPALLRGTNAPPLIAQQAPAVSRVAAPRHARPKAVKIEILRDGNKSESISFVHGRSARNASSLNNTTVGSAAAEFETAGIEAATPAVESRPAAAVAATGARPSAGAPRGRAASPSDSVGFASSAPGAIPFASEPNSKTIDVP